MNAIETSRLYDKVMGCLYGGAVGDALGAPAEWYLPDQIQERYGYITDFVENWEGPSDIGKGDGRTPMTATWCSCLVAVISKRADIWMLFPLPAALCR